ncbi:hypothetical protein Tco_0267787 [Tanacetum coccineum]
MIGNEIVSEVAKSLREERNLGGSNSSDGGNIRDGGKTGDGAIGAHGSGIGEMASEAKRSLDRSSEGSEEVFPDVAGE